MAACAAWMSPLNAAAADMPTWLCKSVFREGRQKALRTERRARKLRRQKKARGPGSAARTGNPFEGSIRKEG